MKKQQLKAEITVETALVLSIILLCYARILNAGFEQYAAAMETARLNEAIELKGHIPDDDSGLFSGYGQRRFEQIVSHELSQGSVEEYKDGYQGSDTFRGHRIQMKDKGFHPEKFMREITVLEIFEDGTERTQNAKNQ